MPRSVNAGVFAATAVVSIAAALIACEDRGQQLLASIDRLGPDVIEPGDIVWIEGGGFVEGPARIVFKGEFKPNGMAEAEQRTVEVDGVATSDTRIELAVTPQVMKSLASSPARFDGFLEVSFPELNSFGAVRIKAKSEKVSIELVPAGGAVEAEAGRSRQASAFLAGLGIVNQRLDETVVSEVAKGSPAARAGIRRGDRLLAIDGVALTSLQDLAGAKRTSSHRISIASLDGAVREVDVEESPLARLNSDELAAVILFAVAIGLFFAFAAPTRRRPEKPYQSSANPIGIAMELGAVSIALLVFPACSINGKAGFGATMLLLGVNALGLALLSLYGSERPFHRLGMFFVHFAPAPAILVVSGTSGSTAGLWQLVSGQQATPWGWHALSSPFAMVSMLAASSLLWPSGLKGERLGKTTAAPISWMAATPAAAMLSAFFLGGWLVPGYSASDVADKGSIFTAGCLIFFAKTWAVLLVSKWLGSSSFDERRAARQWSRPVIRLAVLVAASALSVGWISVDVPDGLRSAGQVVAMTLLAAFVASFAALGLRGRAVWRFSPPGGADRSTTTWRSPS